MKNNNSQNHLERKLRIISGKWRGRKIPFEIKNSLRPTKEIVRETLFNWLDSCLPGSRCLDLFCGTGSLGLEALSRGARHCDFVDKSSSCTKALANCLYDLKADNLSKVHCRDVIDFLSVTEANSYDVVFIDPPFNTGLLNETCRFFSNKDLVLPGGMVYLEFSSSDRPDYISPKWEKFREKKTGSVKYCLYLNS
tara:strand:- start:435 stop:1019 length:585 start_codon:yes stop_codon:yes gene_type:complete